MIHEQSEIFYRTMTQTIVTDSLALQLLDKDGALHFSLLRLQLIELIRKTPTCPDTSAIQEALQFATDNLADRASTNPQWLHEFERAMCLFLFKREDWAKQLQYQQSSMAAPGTATSSSTSTRLNGAASSNANSNTPATPALQPPFGALSELIDPNLRQKVAKDVNEAILRSQDRSLEAKLYQLVRTRAWAEKLAREGKKIDLPEKMPLGLDGDDTEEDSNRVANGEASQNGHSGAVTNGTDSRLARGALLASEAGRDTGAEADAASSSRPSRQDGRSGQESGGASSRAEGDAALAQFTNI